MNTIDLKELLWNDIEANPDSILSKMEYADLLEEEGSNPDLLRGLRYCIKHGKHPAKDKNKLEMTYYYWKCIPINGEEDHHGIHAAIIYVMDILGLASWKCMYIDVALKSLGKALTEMERIVER